MELFECLLPTNPDWTDASFIQEMEERYPVCDNVADFLNMIPDIVEEVLTVDEYKKLLLYYDTIEFFFHTLE